MAETKTNNSQLFSVETYAEYPRPPLLPMAIEGFNKSLLFTNFRGASEVNYQLNYAFNGDLYYYIFGEKVGMAQIEGLAIPQEPSPGCEALKSTARDFVDYYKEKKLGASSNPLRITIGGLVLSGYFVSLSINLIGGRENSYMFSFNFLCRVN